MLYGTQKLFIKKGKEAQTKIGANMIPFGAEMTWTYSPFDDPFVITAKWWEITVRKDGVWERLPKGIGYNCCV